MLIMLKPTTRIILQVKTSHRLDPRVRKGLAEMKRMLYRAYQSMGKPWVVLR